MRADVVDAHDRIADQLAGPVVGDAPAAVGVDDLDPARAVEVLAEGQLAVGRAPTAGVDGRVFEQQQRVGQLLGQPAFADAQLQGERVAVGDRAQVAHP